MSSLVYVSNAVIIAVCIKVIGYFVAIYIDRWKISPFVGVVKAVAICIDACWRDISCSGLCFYVVCDAVVVAVQIKVISNAVAICIRGGLDWGNGEGFGYACADEAITIGVKNRGCVVTQIGD